MHVHIFNDDDKMRARLEQNNRDIEDNLLIGVDNARRTLEAGFTTIRDLGSDVRSVTALRDAINSGVVAGPTIVAAGRGISDHRRSRRRRRTTPTATSSEALRARATNLCNGADDCRRAVREQISQGADVIKFAATGGVNSNIAGGLKQQMFADEMKAIVDTAHMFGRKVAAHAHGQNGIKAALEAGVDSIEHGDLHGCGDERAVQEDRRLAGADDGRAACGAGAGARRCARCKPHWRRRKRPSRPQRKNIAAAIEDGVRIAFGTDTRRVGSRQERAGVRVARQGGHDAGRGDSRRDDGCGDAARTAPTASDHGAGQGRRHHRRRGEPAQRRHRAGARAVRDAARRRAQSSTVRGRRSLRSKREGSTRLLSQTGVPDSVQGCINKRLFVPADRCDLRNQQNWSESWW